MGAVAVGTAVVAAAGLVDTAVVAVAAVATAVGAADAVAAAVAPAPVAARAAPQSTRKSAVEARASAGDRIRSIRLAFALGAPQP